MRLVINGLVFVMTLALVGCSSITIKTVVIRSKPVGAEIKVNNCPLGQTPIAHTFEDDRTWRWSEQPEDFVVEAEAPGYVPGVKVYTGNDPDFIPNVIFFDLVKTSDVTIAPKADEKNSEPKTVEEETPPPAPEPAKAEVKPAAPKPAAPKPAKTEMKLVKPPPPKTNAK